jgi:hypothetical protein
VLKYHHALIISLVLIMMTGCSSKAITGATNGKAAIEGGTSKIFAKSQSEQQMFNEILSYLSNENKEPNYKEAKVQVEHFITEFPDGKWTSAAKSLLVCLDKIAMLQAQLKQERHRCQSDHLKLSKEIDGLRDSTRQNEDKVSAEVTRLQQENEQLKKDIQQLKNLEIQREKR